MKTQCLLVIHWPGGQSHKIGMLEVELTKTGVELKPRWSVARRFGWAMIRQGIRMMIKGDKDNDDGRTGRNQGTY